MAYIVYKDNSNYYVFAKQVGTANIINPNRVVENPSSYLPTSVKAQARLCSTTNLDLTSTSSTIDGISLVDKNRVLLTGQTSKSENGIYFWDAKHQKFFRSKDSFALKSGLFVAVSEGVLEKDTLWRLATSDPIEVKVTPLSFDRVTSSSIHAITHVYGGTDTLGGDLLGLEYVPSNYTRNPIGLATDIHHLTAHLTGIDTVLGASAGGSHAPTHISGAEDPIDGDVLDITYVPSNYTRSTVPDEVTSVLELTAHLAGIDTAISAGASLGSHAPTHISGAGDEIDGDQLDITYTPINYTPDTTPPEVTTTQQLTAHLAGIDTAILGLGGGAPASHAPTHISGAGDEIDGDVLDITYSPFNYTQNTGPGEVTTTLQLTAHLSGIDTYIHPTTIRTLELNQVVDAVTGLISVGQFSFYPAAYGTGKEFQFETVMSVSDVARTATVLLYNLTDGEIVTGTTLTTNSLEPTEKISGALTIGAVAGDLQNTRKRYEIRFSIDGTIITELAFLGSAIMRIS